MKRRKFWTLVISLCLVWFAFPTMGHAQLVLYDDFKTNRIDPNKWLGIGDTTGFLETVRELVPAHGFPGNKRLRLSLTAYAGTAGDSGGVGGVFGLGFMQPQTLREIAFTAVVNAAVAIGCASNPSGAVTEAAEFRGRFFNTEPAPTNQLGDVEVSIGASRSSTDTTSALTVVAFYQRCDDASCAARTTLDFRVLGSVVLSQPFALRIKWDQPNHRFIFQLNDALEVISPYAVSDTSLAVGLGKGIDIAKGVPNCTTTPRPLASMDALFDNVFVNPSP